VKSKPVAVSWVNSCTEGKTEPEAEELHDAGKNSNEGREAKRDEGPEIEEDKRRNCGTHTEVNVSEFIRLNSEHCGERTSTQNTDRKTLQQRY
jgi:hypothetical protein